ncbi:ABC transporter permease [Paenibacillus puldeungensis]|uniref:ABC transporter permease n=1 Tax=Paenibacillus puldeungensis TaxID=696536 RepID=A0ABW3S016_9BACL
MNTLSIAVKEIKKDLRDRRTLALMLAFPLILMLVLGMALTNTFDNTVKVGDIKVLVKDNGMNSDLAQGFEAFSKEAAKAGMTFERLKPQVSGKEEVEQNRFDDYLEIDDHNLSLYMSSRSDIKSSVVQGMLTAFAEKYNVVYAIVKSAPEQAKTTLAAADRGGDYIKETSITADRQPGAVDYYALGMASMTALWGSLSASRLISEEVKEGTAVRLIAAPVRKYEIFIGKVLGNLVVNVLCVLIIVFFSKYVLKAYWGTHLVAELIVLFSSVVMSVSLGLAVSYMLKETATRSVIVIFTNLAAFLGGSYFPMNGDDNLGMLGHISGLSPIRWTNLALTKIVYGNQLSAIWPPVMLNLVLAVIMLAGAALIMRRREGI